jgi:glyoxylase-like metal-dependent hydrolase (beta-lactamase superfamily II)
MTRALVLGLVLALGGTAIAAFAWSAGPLRPGEQQSPAPLEIEKVKESLYLIRGGGGNTAAFITERGVVVVDTKNPGFGQQILEKIRSVTDKPVTMIINTHTHGDHVSGNEAFPTTVEIVAHENTKTNMEKMPAFQGAKQAYLPKRTYKDRLTLLGGRDRVDLYYFGRGHTNGDTIIVFPVLRTAHTGDLFARAGTPLIDMNNGGSGVEYPETLAKAAKGITDVETVIPGHSAVTDWQAFRDYGDFNRDFLIAVQTAKRAGKTAEEAIAAFQLPERWKAYDMRSLKDNVTKIYGELK